MSRNKLIWTKKDDVCETTYTLDIDHLARCSVIYNNKCNSISWDVMVFGSFAPYCWVGNYSNSIKQAKRSAIDALRRECKYPPKIFGKILKRIGS